MDVEGDLRQAEVEEHGEAGGAGGGEPEAGLPRHQHLPLRRLPLRGGRRRCHHRESGLGFLPGEEGLGVCLAERKV